MSELIIKENNYNNIIIDFIFTCSSGICWICAFTDCSVTVKLFCDMCNGGWTLIGQIDRAVENTYDTWLATNTNTEVLRTLTIEAGTYGCINAVNLAAIHASLVTKEFGCKFLYNELLSLMHATHGTSIAIMCLIAYHFMGVIVQICFIIRCCCFQIRFSSGEIIIETGMGGRGSSGICRQIETWTLSGGSPSAMTR